MKKHRLTFLTLIIVLPGACTQDDPREIISGGHPVEVSLPFALAEAKYPQVEVTPGNASATASALGEAEAGVVKPMASGASAAAKAPSASFAESSGTNAPLVRSGAVCSQIGSPLQVSYREPDVPVQTRSGSSFSNVWVLQFDSTLTTGATVTAGACVAARYLGTVTVGDNLNPTLFSGTDQVICVIANGPPAGSITTSDYTLETFKSSASFSGTITGDASVPYLGRIAGGTTIGTNGEVYAPDSGPVITLYRIAAKISMTLDFAVEGYTLSSVELYNTPTYMYYMNGAFSSSFPTASSSYITTTGIAAGIIPETAADGTYAWYTGENKRGENGNITSLYDKYAANAPDDYCTYLLITAQKDGDSEIKFLYTIFPGENGTTDFNIRRNWDYTIDVRIGGNETTQEMYAGFDKRITKTS